VASGRTIDGFAHAVTSRFGLQAARIIVLEAEVAEQRQRAEQAERERDALVEKWPMFVQGGDLVPNEVIDYEDGGWWYGEGKGRRGPFPVREEAVRAAAGISSPAGSAARRWPA